MSFSYATERKIKIIEEREGSEWKEKHPNKSIDAIYNEVVGDTRKNLFCKIKSTSKAKLDEMTDFYSVGMAEFVEQIIDAEYSRYADRKKNAEAALLEEFS